MAKKSYTEETCDRCGEKRINEFANEYFVKAFQCIVTYGNTFVCEARIDLCPQCLESAKKEVAKIFEKKQDVE